MPTSQLEFVQNLVGKKSNIWVVPQLTSIFLSSRKCWKLLSKRQNKLTDPGSWSLLLLLLDFPILSQAIRFLSSASKQSNFRWVASLFNFCLLYLYGWKRMLLLIFYQTTSWIQRSVSRKHSHMGWEAAVRKRKGMKQPFLPLPSVGPMTLGTNFSGAGSD